MSRIENLVLNSAIHNLRQAYKKSGSNVWFAAMKYLSKSSSRRPSVNVGKISRLTKDGDLVIVPGKVLGGGIISHKLTVGAYSFSEKGSWKIRKAGGSAMNLSEFIEKFPDGKGVILIGG